MTFRTGLVAIIGRPNVGKSTLLNHLVGQKVSITSRKAQTTRHRLHGVLTGPSAQFVFVDTPGFQKQHDTPLNRAMNRQVDDALRGVDVVLWVLEAGKFDSRDALLLPLLPKKVPVVLVLNKHDRVQDPVRMAQFVTEMQTRHDFVAQVAVVAKTGRGLPTLLEVVRPLLPEGPALYPEDQLTDRSERFLAAELIREKIFRLLGAELPYAMNVEIEQFSLEGEMRCIHAAVLVDKDSQKAILIGKGGERLKKIATQSRLDMEKLFQGKVFLQVWVKVKTGWSEDVRILKQMGLEP